MNLLLIADLGVEGRVLRLKGDREVQHLHSLLQDDVLAPAETREKPREVIVKLSVFGLLDTHGLHKLGHLLDYEVQVCLSGQKIEDVDPQSLNVLAFFNHNLLNGL